MDFVENLALLRLKHQHSINPIYYGRYMDDIILVFDNTHNYTVDRILSTFNAVRPEINFTLDAVDNYHKKNFLDLTICIDPTKRLSFSWYRKECHSGNVLNWYSNVPAQMKYTNVWTGLCRIFHRNCDLNIFRKNSDTFIDNLAASYYPGKIIMKGINKFAQRVRQPHSLKPVWDPDKQIVRVRFDNQFCFSQRKKTLRNFLGKNIEIVPSMNKPVGHIIRPGSPNPCLKINCTGCRVLDPCCETCCYDEYVVYRIVCLVCNAFYIGKTCRPLDHRIREHLTALRRKTCRSALGIHARTCQATHTEQYMFHILDRGRTPTHVKSLEDFWILKENPPLNRLVVNC